MRLFYHLWYRFGRPPWVMGPRSELVELIESGRLRGRRAVDLGCGTGANAILLAQHGFDVVGVDFAPSAVEQARQNAQTTGVSVQFVVDDLTNLRHLSGPFDVLVDYGTLDDLSTRGRVRYFENIVPLTRPGSQLLLWCFEWELRWWERILTRLLPLGGLAMAPGEVQSRFSRWFAIERIAGESQRSEWPRGYAVYLMERNAQPFEPRTRISAEA